MVHTINVTLCKERYVIVYRWDEQISFVIGSLARELGLSIKIPEDMRNISIGQQLPREAQRYVGHLVALLFESSRKPFK